jgi:hypothetical protein
VIVARELAVAGIAGGATGAYLSTAPPGTVIRPFVSLYLLAMGVVIVWRAIGRFGNDRNTAAPISMPRRVIPLGVVSGLLDAIGGGGWGAMVTSTLIGWRLTPRLAIGSANLAVLCDHRGHGDVRCDNRLAVVANYRGAGRRRRSRSPVRCFHDTETSGAPVDVSRRDRDYASGRP